jgi:SAM-dependent methyltransferase
VKYEPASFWQEILSAHPDLRGTGEPGLSLAYNRAMYAIRERVLTHELARAGVRVAGARVLDGGSGVGFYVDYYLRHGAAVTGIELTEAGTQLLRRRYPAARIVQGDLSDTDAGTGFDVVNVWDVLYHITDDARWERAVRRLARAVAPGGVLLLTDVLGPWRGPLAAHNVMRAGSRYEAILAEEGVRAERTVPTHYLLNRNLGWLKGANRLPHALYAVDRVLLALGAPSPEPCNRLLVSRRPAGAA